jgi:hypothetical protein
MSATLTKGVYIRNKIFFIRDSEADRGVVTPEAFLSIIMETPASSFVSRSLGEG